LQAAQPIKKFAHAQTHTNSKIQNAKRNSQNSKNASDKFKQNAKNATPRNVKPKRNTQHAPKAHRQPVMQKRKQ